MILQLKFLSPRVLLKDTMMWTGLVLEMNINPPQDMLSYLMVPLLIGVVRSNPALFYPLES